MKLDHPISNRLRHLAPVILLLWAHFFIRTHHLDRQDPYIDEGFHITRAAVVWDFDSNPGRFSHGKVLLYFWLGLFETDPQIALPTARLGLAIWSLIGAATVYTVGRQLFGGGAGLAALGIYAALPLAFFYERMAMADPFAAGFAGLIAWRALIFARRPTWREGAVLGALFALATLAKLTMIMLPALPVIAALVYTPWRRANLRGQVWAWMLRYMPPMMLAAGVMALGWLPLLVPAYLARDSAEPFLLINNYNLRGADEQPYTPQRYLARGIPLMRDFTGRGLQIAALGWLTVDAVLFDRRRLRGVLFGLGWLALIVAPLLLEARLLTARYMMPLAALLALGVGAGAARLWALPWGWAREVARGGVIVAAGAWLIGFALPFARTDLSAPDRLPLHSTNYIEYIGGALSGDDPIRAAAQTLNAADPPVEHLYANWNLCHLLYFYTDQPVTCLALNQVRGDLVARLNAEVAPGETALVALRGYQPFLDTIDGICYREIARHESTRINRPVTVWRVQRAPC